MVEAGTDCSQVLTQLAAVKGAINSVCEIILKDHMEHCIVDAVKTNDLTALDDLEKAVKLLISR
jgi:DNA-binding FrmR family transcriptional regulator